MKWRVLPLLMATCVVTWLLLNAIFVLSAIQDELRVSSVVPLDDLSLQEIRGTVCIVLNKTDCGEDTEPLACPSRECKSVNNQWTCNVINLYPDNRAYYWYFTYENRNGFYYKDSYMHPCVWYQTCTSTSPCRFDETKKKYYCPSDASVAWQVFQDYKDYYAWGTCRPGE